MLLPPRKLPGWLSEAATKAERELTAVETDDGRAKYALDTGARRCGEEC